MERIAGVQPNEPDAVISQRALRLYYSTNTHAGLAPAGGDLSAYGSLWKGSLLLVPPCSLPLGFSVLCVVWSLGWPGGPVPFLKIAFPPKNTAVGGSSHLAPAPPPSPKS